MESVHALLLMLGIVALILSWLILLIYSAREDFTWALFTLLLPPVSYLYGLFRWQKAKEPILIALAGCILIALALRP